MYPVRDVILATREITKKTQGGLYLPDNQQTAEDRAEVVAVGPGVYDPDRGTFIPTAAKMELCKNGIPVLDEDGLPEVVAGVKVGDVVLFDKRSAFDFTHGGRKFIALPATAIAVVIPAEADQDGE